MSFSLSSTPLLQGTLDIHCPGSHFFKIFFSRVFVGERRAFACLRRRELAGQWEGTLANTMFSHVVIFWTDPAQPNAAAELVAGANKYLKNIPGVIQFHVGLMSPSPRPVVDQTYQVALNLIFPSKQAEQDYQVHPQHIEFVEKVFKKTCKQVRIFDFE